MEEKNEIDQRRQKIAFLYYDISCKYNGPFLNNTELQERMYTYYIGTSSCLYLLGTVHRWYQYSTATVPREYCE
jgi:hypothetical protein